MNFPRTPCFVGREAFLQSLHTTLQRERRAVVAGIDGMGKTATAREYIRRVSSQYRSIFWVNAARDETFLADLCAAAQSLSLNVDLTRGAADLLQTILSHLDGQEAMLFVLDDLPFSFTPLESSEQQHAGSHLLLITHARNATPGIARLELSGLDEREGALLVLRQAGLLDAQAPLEQTEEELRTAALELAASLRGLPLALSLAGGYLRGTGCNIQDYLDDFRAGRSRLRTPEGQNAQDIREVMRACERSLVHLEQAQPAALELLHICALLSSETLPRVLFAETVESGSAEPDPHQAVLRSLLTFGLLNGENEDSVLSIHPLIQAFVCQFCEPARQQRVELALRLLQRRLQLLEKEELPTHLRIAGSICHLAALSGGEELSFVEAAETFAWAASLFWEQRLIGLAEPLLRRALNIWERELGHAHPTVATVLGNLATINGLLKNYVEAEALAHRAIISKSEALGVNHPDVLFALDDLGHFYAAQGKQKEARLCYEKVISLSDRLGLRAHPVHVTAMYDLALLYIEQENFVKAEALLQKVCSARDWSPGPQDPSTIAAWFSLAEVCVRLKNWKRAEAAYWRALPVCEKLLGEEHPVTLDHLERAADVFRRRGNLVEAKRALKRVLAAREREPEDQRPRLASCLNGLARIDLESGQYGEALALLERARGIYDEQTELDKLALADLLDTRAALEAAQKHYEQAISTYEQALELRRQSLGGEHLDLVENLSNLASLYLAQEQPRRAEPLLLQALYIYQKAQKAEDLALDSVLDGLADIEIGRGHFEMARMYLERLRAVREVAFGQSDPRVAQVLKKLERVVNA